MTAAQLSKLYRRGKASPVEAMRAVLKRSDTVNPRINAFCRVDGKEAIAAARAAEKRWKKGKPLSAIDGVPVSIKELVRVKGWPASMGSKLPDKTPADADAPAVARLREAGAIVFAQSTSSEYGHKGVTDSPLNGVTRNPWNLERTPGGSSGGAGAAVAAGLGPLAIGTDGGGSIRIPASFCGLYGLKPSFGRVPPYPAFRGWETFSHTGPLTRTVRDAALMLDLIAGPDDRDRYSLPGDGGPSFVAACDAGIAGLSVAWSPDVGHAAVDPEVVDLCAHAAERFEALGCHVEVVSPTCDNPEENFRVLAAAETHAAWGAELADRAEQLDRSLV